MWKSESYKNHLESWNDMYWYVCITCSLLFTFRLVTSCHLEAQSASSERKVSFSEAMEHNWTWLNLEHFTTAKRRYKQMYTNVACSGDRQLAQTHRRSKPRGKARQKRRTGSCSLTAQVKHIEANWGQLIKAASWRNWLRFDVCDRSIGKWWRYCRRGMDDKRWQVTFGERHGSSWLRDWDAGLLNG